jgi:oligoendopeptidase F
MTRIRFLTTFLILTLVTASLMVVASDVPDNKGAIPQRDEIENQYKWKVEDMYPDPTAWEADFELLKSSLDGFAQYKGKLSESPEKLLNCLKLRDSLYIITSDLFVYAYLKLDEDNRRSEFQELGGRISALDAQVEEAVAFIEPEILTLDPAKLESFLKQNSELAGYRFYLEDQLRRKDHILSPGEEEIMAMAGPLLGAPLKIFNMIDNADHKVGTIIDAEGDTVELTWGRYSLILKGSDREQRRIANDTVQTGWLKYINTLTATLGSSIEKDLFVTKARKYNSTLERSLDNNKIPESVFHNMIEAVNANLPLYHKWVKLRKKVLGYDTLYTYDLSVPLVPDFQKEYSYADGMEILQNGLKPMGSQYLKDLDYGLASGWVDVFENEGKGSGAYSWGTYTSHPYVLMNFDGTIDNVFTLAHEMGHALHSYYTDRREPYIYHGHSLFTAEVASTCNEAILMKYLLSKTESKDEKIMLLNHYINQIDGTFITQIMFSEYELMLHKHIQDGGALSVDFIRKTYRELLQKYWGPDVVIGPNNDMGAMKLYHYYRTYYVYKYASSYAAAQMISQKILEGDQKALDAYLNFLTVGSSKYPMDILMDAGVDMNSSEPVDRTLKLFGELVDEMERLLEEI